MKVKILKKGTPSGGGSQAFTCDFVIDEPPQEVWKDKKSTK